MPKTPPALARLLAYHENAAASVRLTIALMTHQNGHAPAREYVAATARDAAALAIDSARRAYTAGGTLPKKPAKRPAHPRGFHAEKVRAQRQRTAAFLAKFDPETPRDARTVGTEFKAAGIGAIVRRGYLKKKGPGYVRTAKQYRP